MDTVRTLLLGALAVQEKLIEPGQLAQAYADSLGQQDTSLLDVMKQRGWLSDADAVRLHERAEKELAQHGGAAHPSLRTIASMVRGRRKTLLTCCVVLLLATVVALSVTTVLIGQERARTEAEAKRAQDNFRLARSAVDRYFVQISEQRLLNEPGMTPLRQELLHTAADYYAEFVKKHEDDPALRAEFGNALFKLARINRDLGHRDKAMSYDDQARTTFATLLAKSPNDRSLQFALAKCYHLRGALLLDKGTHDEAEKAIEAAVLILDHLAAEKAVDPEVQKIRANAHSNLGVVYSRQARKTGPADKARYEELRRKEESAFSEAVLIHQALVEREQKSPHLFDYRDELAASYTNLAGYLHSAGKFELAREHLQAALSIHQDLVRQDGKTIRFRRHLTKSLNNMATSSGNTNEALTYLRKVVAIREAIAAENPRVPVYQEELASGLSNLAMWHVRRADSVADKEAARKEYAAAVDAYQKALAKYEALDRDKPQTPSYLEGMGIVLTGLGTVSYVADDFKTARTHYEKAIGLLETAYDHGHATEALMDSLCEASWGLAGIETAARKWAEALPRWRYALEHDRPERERKALFSEALAALEKARAAGFFNDPAHRKMLAAFGAIEPFGKSPEFQAFMKKVATP